MTQTDTTARLSDDAIDTIVYHYCPDLPDGNADAIWEHEPQATMTMLVRSHRALAADLADVTAENVRLKESLRLTDSALAYAREILEDDGYVKDVFHIDGITLARDEQVRAALRTHAQRAPAATDGGGE